jgi:hypothetical protein
MEVISWSEVKQVRALPFLLNFRKDLQVSNPFIHSFKISIFRVNACNYLSLKNFPLTFSGLRTVSTIVEENA